MRFCTFGTNFRVDKLDDSWEGSLSIGGVPCLPTDSVPECAMRLDPPAWILSSDLQFNGTN
ncbi:jg2403, partial [Pararge aegeria aegeria]